MLCGFCEATLALFLGHCFSNVIFQCFEQRYFHLPSIGTMVDILDVDISKLWCIKCNVSVWLNTPISKRRKKKMAYQRSDAVKYMSFYK